MRRIAALLRRYSTLLFLTSLCLLAAATVVQSLRLRYLEDRHLQMFTDFGEAQLAIQFKANELQQQLRACRSATPASPHSTRR